jgi:multiple sugar transport system ATP-binding protein
LGAVVDASEPLGNEVLLYLRAARQDITARAEPHVLPRPGDRLSLGVDPGRVHYFDRASGRSI